MKPLLRALLLINAIVTFAFALLLLATPFAFIYDTLQLIPASPAFVGQLFGVALLGIAWLQGHAAVRGDLTVPVGRVSGHVNWISGVIMLIWLVALHRPGLNELGKLVGPAVGVILLIYGLCQVRLCAAVRRRERALDAGAQSAARAERRAAQARTDPRTEPRTDPRVDPVTPNWNRTPAGRETPVVVDTPVESRPVTRTPAAPTPTPTVDGTTASRPPVAEPVRPRSPLDGDPADPADPANRRGFRE